MIVGRAGEGSFREVGRWLVGKYSFRRGEDKVVLGECRMRRGFRKKFWETLLRDR